MNFKRKWLFLVLPLLVLSAALFGVKWKRENPTPTARDLEARKRILASRQFVITPPMYMEKRRGRRKPNQQESRFIAEHLCLQWNKQSNMLLSYGMFERDFTLIWTNGSGQVV